MKAFTPTALTAAVLGGVLVLAASSYLLAVSLLPAHDRDSQPEQQQVLQESLTRLSSAATARERLQAARFIGEKSTTVNSYQIQHLSRALTSDPDPSVRAAVATTFGEIAARHSQGTARPGPQEPQMIEALSAAFDRESNASVRRCIIQAAAEFNDAQAAYVLTKALVDVDPSVREAAQEARLKRERRKLAALSG
jgi:hypothetical protein